LSNLALIHGRREKTGFGYWQGGGPLCLALTLERGGKALRESEAGAKVLSVVSTCRRANNKQKKDQVTNPPLLTQVVNTKRPLVKKKLPNPQA